MMGVFVQLNGDSAKGAACPLGYVIQENGCWDWVGATKEGGYGKMRRGGRFVLAHRWVYERERGPIPVGLTLDHLCNRPVCVNPGHMKPCTIAENALRGTSLAAQNARKTHCKKGHEYTEANTHTPRRRGRGVARRVCRTCMVAKLAVLNSSLYDGHRARRV